MQPYLLGIDNGGTASKAALYTLDGRQIVSISAPVSILEPCTGWSERDAERMWLDTAALIRQVIARAEIDPASIVAVACTGYGNGLYLIDESGAPVRPGINSSDTRAQPIVDQWRASGVESQAMSWTAQQLWAAQPPPLLSWLRRHEPEVFRRTRWILLCKDYIRYRLTGEIFAERTDYSGASLLDVGERAMSPDLLNCFGLDEVAALLPPLIESHDLAGGVSARAAAETGLQAGTPVAGGMFDIDACCLASGVLDERHVAMAAGTWGNCLSVSDQAVNDPEVFMTSCFSVPGKFLLLEGSPTSAANLDWAIREFGVRSYEEAEAAAASASPPIPAFLPFLYGSHAGPEASACFLGLHASTTQAHMLRAVFEAVCFAQRFHFERLMRFRGVPEAVRLTGGATRSPFWCQLFSDTLGVPVEIPQGEELGAKGAAIAASIAAGLHRNYTEAVNAMTGTERRYEPSAAPDGTLAGRFERYRHILTRLEGVWPLFDRA